MPISHFDRSALPPPQTFYERELGELRRPSRGWATPKRGCPFHDSKSKTSFRVNLETGGFHCFGCGAKGGDVLAFVRLRHNMSFKDAAKELGAWHDEGLKPEHKWKLDAARQEQARILAEEIARKERERAKRIFARDHLHAVETLYDEAIAEHDWLGMSELLPRVRQAEELYWRTAGLEVRHER